jgi:hypothetical protein
MSSQATQPLNALSNELVLPPERVPEEPLDKNEEYARDRHAQFIQKSREFTKLGMHVRKHKGKVVFTNKHGRHSPHPKGTLRFSPGKHYRKRGVIGMQPIGPTKRVKGTKGPKPHGGTMKRHDKRRSRTIRRDHRSRR